MRKSPSNRFDMATVMLQGMVLMPLSRTCLTVVMGLALPRIVVTVFGDHGRADEAESGEGNGKNASINHVHRVLREVCILAMRGSCVSVMSNTAATSDLPCSQASFASR